MDMGTDEELSLGELLGFAVDTRLILTRDGAGAIMILLGPLEAETRSREVRQAAAEIRRRIGSRLHHTTHPRGRA